VFATLVVLFVVLLAPFWQAMEHDCVVVLDPAQSNPFPEGVGFVHERVRICCPVATGHTASHLNSHYRISKINKKLTLQIKER
jgi:hypothetical protein